MACGCGKRAGSSNAAGGPSAGTYTYKVTTPAGEVKNVATPLEAKREIRRAGGGTIERELVDARSEA